MRNENEILERLDIYKEELAFTLEDKEYNKSFANRTMVDDYDLIIFSLVDKIEALLWVLQLELYEENSNSILSSINKPKN